MSIVRTPPPIRAADVFVCEIGLQRAVRIIDARRRRDDGERRERRGAREPCLSALGRGGVVRGNARDRDVVAAAPT